MSAPSGEPIALEVAAEVMDHTEITASWDLGLITLSYVVAVFASYTALNLAGRVVAAQGRAWLLWLAGGAFAMGTGIWSMHFTGMLAFDMGMPVSYDVPITLLSAVIAIAASGLALFVVGRGLVGMRPLLVAGPVMGAGIAAMHYTGMAAMRMQATISYDPLLLALSVLIAMAASMAALYLSFHLNREDTRWTGWLKGGSALVMGAAIVGMHYTGMAAASYTPTAREAAPSYDVHGSALGFGVGFFTLLILGLALAGAVIDRRFSAQALRLEESEARYARVAANAPGMVFQFMLHPDGSVAFPFVSEGSREIYGLEPREIQQNPALVMDAIYPEDRASFERSIAESAASLSPWRWEGRIALRSGERKWVQGASRPERQAGGKIVWDGMLMDITERKRAEEEIRQLNENLEEQVRERTARLRASEARLRALFAGMEDVVTVLDAQGRIMEIAPTNPSRLYGLPTDSPGKTLHGIFPQEQADTFLERIRHALKTRQTLYLEHSLPAKEREVWFTVTISPMTENSVVWVSRDITERKRAEEDLKEYAARLQHSNRELRDFVRVASHDLQEPLRKVRTFSDRLKAKHAEALGEQGRDYLERMENAAARMQKLIEDLLALSRVTTQARPFALVDLTRVAEEVVSDLEARIERVGGQVMVGELPTVEADRVQMRQLLQNLIGNALKFHKAGEAPVVEVYGEVPGDREESPDGNPQANKLCRIIVKDNGIGFEEKYLEQIFALFQRLHGRDAYEGTGMGLAICRKVVERHSGWITAKSTPGHGATFVVTLPVNLPEGETYSGERGKTVYYAVTGR